MREDALAVHLTMNLTFGDKLCVNPLFSRFENLSLSGKQSNLFHIRAAKLKLLELLS